MTSKLLCAVALAACALCTARAAEVDPSAVAAYYQKNLKDKPQGVYAWPEKGLLFVQVRVSRDAADTDDVSGLALMAEQRELYAWLAAKAGRARKDAELPFGLERVRRLVRANDPLWEYTADWAYKLDGQEFSREEGNVRVACAVCDQAAVEATMPAAFLEPAPPETWLEGGRKLVEECHLGRVNAPFMATVGLLDGAELHSTSNFDGVAAAKDTAAHAEYLQVRAELADYLKTSPRAAGIRAARARIRAFPPKLDVAYDVPADLVTTNVAVHVSTNRAVAANAVTNIREVAAGTIGDVMPRGGTFMARTVRTDAALVTTVATTTVVRVRRTLVQNLRTDYFGDPRFEDLFLAGGAAANAPSARTELGRAAERAFAAPGTQEEHERCVLAALRENPGDKVLWNLYGRLLQAQKDWPGALICFRAALRLDPAYQYALVNLATTYEAMGRRELAVAAALVAHGVATDAWCADKAKAILLK